MSDERKAQAVILIHGMGEQTPMGTLRKFVETMWCLNPRIDAKGNKCEEKIRFFGSPTLE